MIQGARLLDVQQKYREMGRVRMGKKGAKGQPQKLDVWRLTSGGDSGRELLEKVAELYGGTVEPWPDAPDEGDWWQITTETASLEVVVPPGEVLSQYWEQWSGGGCKKRCDGVNQVLVDRPCSCPDDIAKRLEKAQTGNACKPVTRLSVMLRGIRDVGVWRLETHGMNAAQELPGTYDILRRAAEVGALLPARLTIASRSSKKDGKTQRFKVPVLELMHTVDEVAAGLSQLKAGEGSQIAGELPAAPPPVERKNMPATGAEPAGPPPEDASWQPPAERAPIPEPSTAGVLPEWIVQLPGYDDDILRAAEAVAAEAGKPVTFKSLHDLAAVPVSPDSQRLIRERLETEGHTPVQESLT